MFFCVLKLFLFAAKKQNACNDVDKNQSANLKTGSDAIASFDFQTKRNRHRNAPNKRNKAADDVGNVQRRFSVIDEDAQHAKYASDNHKCQCDF